jgi:4-hydroxy-2-oxoheptanedioate aldolase
MVNDPETAQDAVRMCRYPPLGERSYGPIRSRLFIGADPEVANLEILCLVQIETRRAMANLDAILSVEGVDGVYVGTADLALSHGISPGMSSDEVDGMLATIVEACARLGRIPGIHTTSGTDCRSKMGLGFRMLSIGSDSVWLHAGYATQVATARAEESSSGGGLY